MSNKQDKTTSPRVADQRKDTLLSTLAVDPNLHKGFSIADIIVQPDIGVIIRDNERYHLAPKAMEILVLLASMPGKIVSREHILEFGWGDVSRSSSTLTHIISEIRHVLNDHKECPHFIQTIPRKGYRLLVDVEKKSKSGFFKHSDPEPTDSSSKNTAWKFSISIIKSSRLFKASAAYVVISWVLLQVFALVLPIFNAPSWSVKFSTLVLIVGFPVVLAFQWAQDIKVKRKQHRKKEKKLKFIYRQLAVDSFFILIVLCVIYYLSTHLITFIEEESIASESMPVIPQAIIVDNAVAILSFSNGLKPDMPEYLASGIQEELISYLTQKPEFQVASLRATNAIDNNASIEELKNALGVKYIVEGKVTFENNSLIISSIIIDSITGFQVWTSQTKGSSEQVLPIYEELSRKVLNALNFIVLGNSSSEETNNILATNSFEAYDLYLQGKSEVRKTKSTSSLLKAESYLLKSINIDPQFILAIATLCRTYMELYQLTDDPAQYQKGVEVCELSANYKNVSVESYLSLGRLYRISGSYEEARQTLETAKELDSTNPEVLITLARVYVDLENNDEAEKLFLKSISIEPAFWENYYQYGIFLYNSGQYEKAIPQFNKVNLLNNKIALAYNALGGVYFLSMDFKNASLAWSNALEIEPSALTYSNLGTSLFFQQEFDQAVDVYQKSVALSPNDNTVWANLADSLKYSTNRQDKNQVKDHNTGVDTGVDNGEEAYKMALRLAKQKEQINPNDIDLKAQIARYYSELNHCEESQIYQDSVLHHSSTDPYIYYDLAISSINCQQTDQAKIMIIKLIEFNYPQGLLLADPQFLAYKEQLAQLYNSE